jgi:hypothetical protein
MKNVTITLDEATAGWARVEAAKEGKSLSRYLSDMLAERRGRQMTQREALERFLSAPDFPGIMKDLPTREELYAERLFRRHEHTPVREGPARKRKKPASRKLAAGAHAKRTRHRKSAGAE